VVGCNYFIDHVMLCVIAGIALVCSWRPTPTGPSSLPPLLIKLSRLGLKQLHRMASGSPLSRERVWCVDTCRGGLLETN